MSNRSNFGISAFSLAAVAAFSLAMTGCGVGITSISSGSVATPVAATTSIHGTALGGTIPILGATVTLWETDPGSTGYPTAINAASGTQGAKILRSTTTYSATTTVGTGTPTDTITAYSINSSNVVTFTAANTLQVGEQVALSGFPTSTFFNGKTLIVATASATQFTAGFTHAAVAATTESGSAVETPATYSAGSFELPVGYACDAASGNTSVATANSTTGGTAGPFLYLTVTGGNTGAGANNNMVLINALGSCSYLLGNGTASSIHVIVNEASTVAAAYALGNFIYVDNTTPGSQKVYIGAPANNNAATGSCTGTGSSMVCSAAGLSHGFYNAYNLSDTLSYAANPDGGAEPSGAARTTIVANPDAGTLGNANASVPQAELHALANILQGCVNSPGGGVTNTSGTYASDATSCGNIFYLATAPTGTSTPSYPTDTLTAAINIAHNPYNSVGALFGKIPSSPQFLPTLASAPHDWSVGIIYTGLVVGSTSTPFSAGNSVALDANDDVFVASTNATGGYVSAMSSSGAGLWTTTASTTVCAPDNVATDTLGNVWVANFSASTSTCPEGLYAYSQFGGGLQQSLTNAGANSTTSVGIGKDPYGLAVDRNNNLWYGLKSTSCAGTASGCLGEVPYTPGTGYGTVTNVQTFANVASPGVVADLYDADQIVLDSNQNVWAGLYEGGGTTTDDPIVVLPNTAAVGATPTYGTPLAPATTGEAFGMLAIDSANKAWTGIASHLYYYTLNGSNTSTPTLSALTDVADAASKPIGGEWDGNGKVFYPSYSSTGQTYFYSPQNVAAGATFSAGNMEPCYVPNGATTCTNNTGNDEHSLQIDSSGVVWVAAPAISLASFGAASGYVLQILGHAAPTWPQLSYAHLGAEPQ